MSHSLFLNAATSTSTSASTEKFAAKNVANNEGWIHRNQLQQGMYVLELDKPWDQTPFLFQGFYLDSPGLIEAVQMECEYVLVRNQCARQSVG